MIDVRGLNLLVAEANELSSKASLNKHQERRFAYLQTAISAVKAGATLAEVDHQLHNERALASGLSPVDFKKLNTTEREARAWQAMLAGEETFKAHCVAEKRDMVEGDIPSRIGTYSGMGYFVPSGFFPQLFRSLKAHDALFDEESVTLIKSTNGRPLPIPTTTDTSVVADLISESYGQTSTDIFAENHTVLGAYSFSSPRFVFSIESEQDMDSAITMTSLAKEFFGDRIARGVGSYLINGTGINQPTGLLTALAAKGAPIVNAVGSADNDGASGGTVRVGSNDLASALEQLDAAYAVSPKCAWAMNHNTLIQLASIVDKMGQLLNLVKFDDEGNPSIFGIGVIICPSLPDLAPGAQSIVLGDFSYWATRLVADEQSGMVVYREAQGLVEYGNVGVRSFVRADGNLIWAPDPDSPAAPNTNCPFVVVECISSPA
jgi:HK97 family phage major capsid protein